MKSNVLKSLIATVILIVPAILIFIGIRTVKTKVGLEVLNPQSDSCPTNQVEGVHRIPAFALTSQTGQQFTDRDLAGKIYIANFFFTRCPDICLQMSSELTRVQTQFKANPLIRIVSHTVDPKHDSVAVLQQYAQRYNANPQIWTMLTGDKATIYELARCGYFVSAKAATSDLATDFIHSDKLVLIDKEKRIRGFYSGTKREEVDRLILEIRVLLTEYQ